VADQEIAQPPSQPVLFSASWFICMRMTSTNISSESWLRMLWLPARLLFVSVVAKRMKLSSRPFDATDLPRPRRMKRGSESSSGKYLPPAAGVESPLAGQKGLAGDLIALIDELNTYGDGTMLVADGDDVDHK